MIKEILIGVLTIGLIGIFTYVIQIEKNQVHLLNISKQLKEIKRIGDENTKALGVTKLFVGRAHPDRDASMLISLMKLREVSDQDMRTIALQVQDDELALIIAPEEEIGVLKLPEKLIFLSDKYNLTVTDLVNYSKITASDVVNTEQDISKKGS